MVTQSSILAWRIPWTEEPGGLQSMGSQSRPRLSDFTFTFFFFLILFYFKTLHNCISFAKYQNESAIGIHVFPILNPPSRDLRDFQITLKIITHARFLGRCVVILRPVPSYKVTQVLYLTTTNKTKQLINQNQTQNKI